MGNEKYVEILETAIENLKQLKEPITEETASDIEQLTKSIIYETRKEKGETFDSSDKEAYRRFARRYIAEQQAPESDEEEIDAEIDKLVQTLKEQNVEIVMPKIDLDWDEER